MGIMSVQQAEELKMKALFSMDAISSLENRRPSKRIYFRPVKQKKRITKIKFLNPDRLVFCNVCRKRVEANSAVEVIGGSEQGHKTFWMCREHV